MLRAPQLFWSEIFRFPPNILEGGCYHEARTKSMLFNFWRTFLWKLGKINLLYSITLVMTVVGKADGSVLQEKLIYKNLIWNLSVINLMLALEMFYKKGLKACNLTKTRLQHRRFPVKIWNFKEYLFWRTPVNNCFWKFVL